MFEDYYSILGLESTATSEQIKSAYRSLAKKFHPDKHAGDAHFEEKFKSISEAYNTLSDQEKKQKYDQRYEYYLHSEIFGSTSTTSYSTPNSNPKKYHKPPVYSTKKREYTPKAWMWAKIVVIGMISLIVLAPLGLARWSSTFNYNKAVELENQGDFKRALDHYRASVKRFGAYNLEACLGAGYISLYHSKEYETAIYYFQKSFDFTNNDSLESILTYRIGIASMRMKDFTGAKEALEKVENNPLLKDSVILMMSEINAYALYDYASAIDQFDYLIENNINNSLSWFGKGYCLYNLSNFTGARECYTNAINIDKKFAIAYYFRGLSQVSLKDSLEYCADFDESLRLGYTAAKQAVSKFCKNN